MKILSIILLSLLVFGCSTSKTSSSANPEAPTEAYRNQDVKTERLTSTISVPVSISLDDIEKQINQGITGLIYEDDSYDNNGSDLLKMKVWKNGNIVFTGAKNDVFDYTIPLKIWANKQISIFGIKQDKSTTFEMKLNFSSRFAIAPDWSIQTISSPNGFTFVSEPRISFNGISIAITPIIGKIIENNQAGLAKTIDEAAHDQVSIKPFVVDAWNLAAKPFEISEEYKTWMLVTPINLVIMPLESSGRTIKTRIGINAYTETVTGVVPVAPAFTNDIPKLKYVTSIPEEFQVALQSTIPYAEATRVAQSMFKNQTYKFQNDRYQITVTDMDIYGNNDKLVVKLTTTGDLTGDVYLQGIPVYNPAKKQIELSNTQLDVKTKNVLVKVASWLVGGALEKKVQNEFAIPLEELMIFAKENVEKSINNEFVKGVRLQGNLTSITPEKVIITREGISTVVKTTGKVNLDVKGL